MKERETTTAHRAQHGDRAHAGSGGVLEGIRVLDFTRQMSGPYASLLGDFGADVVKVGQPPAGEPARKPGREAVP